MTLSKERRKSMPAAGSRRHRSGLLPLLILLHALLCAVSTASQSPTRDDVDQWLRFLEEPSWAENNGNGKGKGNGKNKRGNGNSDGKWVSQGEDKDHTDDEWEESDSVDEESEDIGDRSASDDGTWPLQVISKPTWIPTQLPTPSLPLEDAPASTTTDSAASSDPYAENAPAAVPVFASLVLDLFPIAESDGTMGTSIVGLFEDACETFVSAASPLAVENASCQVWGQELLLPPLPDGLGDRRILERKRRLEMNIADTSEEDGVANALLRVDISISGQVPTSLVPSFQGTLVTLFQMRRITFISMLKEENSEMVTQPEATINEGRKYFNTVETLLVISDGGAVWGVNDSANQDASDTGISRGLTIFVTILAVLVVVALVGVGLVFRRRRMEAIQRAWAAAPRLRPKRSSIVSTSAQGDANSSSSGPIPGRQDRLLIAVPIAGHALEDEDACTDTDGCRNDKRCQPMLTKLAPSSGNGIGSFEYEEAPVSAKDEHHLTKIMVGTQDESNGAGQVHPVNGSMSLFSCGDPLILSGPHVPEEASAVPPSLAHNSQITSVPYAVSSVVPSNVGNELVSLSLPSAVPSLPTNGEDSTVLGAPSAFSVAAVTVESRVPVPRDQAMSSVGIVPQSYAHLGMGEKGCLDQKGKNEEDTKKGYGDNCSSNKRIC